MNRKLLAVMVVLASFAFAACTREAPVAAPDAPPATGAPATVAAPTGTDLSDAGVQPDAAGFSAKGFAGTFKGKLPCADCPGIDETLVLAPDGSFTLTDVYQERPQGTRSIAGSWTTEDDDARLRLDPNTKSEPDRLYGIASNDEIAQLGVDGQPATDGLDYQMHRVH